MELAKYQRNFPAGVALPDLLCKLFEFQNRSEQFFSGQFELDAWEYGDATWFGGDADAARRFVVFGHGPDGSLYALWLYDGATVENAPVVVLDSEGCGNGVICSDLTEFFGLLAIGADEVRLDEALTESSKPAARLSEFRSWLTASLGIAAPTEPSALMNAARRRHPGFESWFEAWLAARSGR